MPKGRPNSNTSAMEKFSVLLTVIVTETVFEEHFKDLVILQGKSKLWKKYKFRSPNNFMENCFRFLNLKKIRVAKLPLPVILISFVAFLAAVTSSSLKSMF